MQTFMVPPRGHLTRLIAIDSGAWLFAVVLAGTLRTIDPLNETPWVSLLLIGLGAGVAQALIGMLAGVYRRRFIAGSFEEAVRLAGIVVAVGVVVLVVGLVLNRADGLPRSLGLLAAPIAAVIILGARLIMRARLQTKLPVAGRTPVLIYGAGYLGTSIAWRMRTDRASDFRPLGYIDDDAAKHGIVIHGLKVLGGYDAIDDLIEATGAKAVVLCMSEVGPEAIGRISDVNRDLGVETLSLPPLNDILRGKSSVKDLRSISIEDVLGRRPVELDMASIDATITGKRILVTGAGGSIGSELCRQVSRFSPAELMMLDRDETGLQQTQLSIQGHGLLDSNDLILADIRDPETLHAIMLERRPDVVFHAAALKHLPLLEAYPSEGWKTNVLGTLNVLNAARAAGVPTFVNISTDKAADPTSFLGKSKRMAERLTAWAGDDGRHRYMSVRFGNVIGSRGSMLPTFQTMIENGGPVTVTDPEVTRYFMTIPEACQLVLQAGAIGRPGEVMILDMGQPVKILDIARRMIRLSARDVEITFTGLRPGEKLHEDLIGKEERGESPFHPKIFHAEVAPLSPDTLDERRWREETIEHALPALDGFHSPFTKNSAGSPQEPTA